jgi:transposase
MVAAVRQGLSVRATARRFGVSTGTVCYWVARAAGQRLDRVDWLNRSRAPKRPRRTDTTLEDSVLRIRRELQKSSDLGTFGAQAIYRALQEQRQTNLPSVRTINRILQRRGALDGRKRGRRPPPPRGWYLPALATAAAELDSFDIGEGLVIKGGPQVEVFNGASRCTVDCRPVGPFGPR